MARLSETQRLDRRTIRKLLGKRPGGTPRISSMESRHAEGLPAHQQLGGMSIEGPDEARAGVGLKGLEDFIPHMKDPSGKKKIASLASGRTRRSGRFRRNLHNSDADRHGTVRPDPVRHGICLSDGAWQCIFVLDAWCQGIFLLDAAMSGHFPSGRSRVRANGIRMTRVMAPWLRWLSRHGTSQQILASHSQTRSGFQAQ